MSAFDLDNHESPQTVVNFLEDETDETSILSKYVDRGARWLDAVRPNWASEIVVYFLDMGDGDSCVLGQLARTVAEEHGINPDEVSYSTFFNGYRGISKDNKHTTCIQQAFGINKATEGFANFHGFNLPEYLTSQDGDDWTLYAILDKLWIDKIRERVSA